MLSGLLITLNILVCISLIAVVLLQRSEGGAFGSSGNPGGLVTARGAGDLLTRTTWILFAVFLALSLGLTLLGAHDKASSGVLDKLKLQQANPNALVQKPATPAPGTAPLQGAPGQTLPGQGAPSPFGVGSPAGLGPAPMIAPQQTPAPAVAGKTPAATAKTAAAHVAATKPAAKTTTVPVATPATSTSSSSAAPPMLIAPPPAAKPPAAEPPAAQPKSDPNAPVSTGQP